MTSSGRKRIKNFAACDDYSHKPLQLRHNRRPVQQPHPLFLNNQCVTSQHHHHPLMLSRQLAHRQHLSHLVKSLRYHLRNANRYSLLQFPLTLLAYHLQVLLLLCRQHHMRLTPHSQPRYHRNQKHRRYQSQNRHHLQQHHLHDQTPLQQILRQHPLTSPVSHHLIHLHPPHTIRVVMLRRTQTPLTSPSCTRRPQQQVLLALIPPSPHPLLGRHHRRSKMSSLRRHHHLALTHHCCVSSCLECRDHCHPSARSYDLHE